jgi:hypothetical protein
MNETTKYQRTSLGFVSMLLGPVLLFLGLFGQNNSPTWYHTISDTFMSNGMQIFIGCLCIMFFFFMSYKCYDWRDHVVNKISGISALLIAIFPSGDFLETYQGSIGVFPVPPNVSSFIHGAAAGILFITLTVNILWLFTLSDGTMTDKKRNRNIVYYICGSIMVLSIAIWTIGVLTHLGDGNIWKYICEIFLLIPFGFAWLVKGQAIPLFND